MAAPVVTATLDQSAAYAPGAPIAVSWTVVDADNSTERLILEGADSQGNAVTMTVDVARQDVFTMTRVYWERTGTNLAVNNGTRSASGVVPSA
jgi:hypothetical protein